MTSRPKKFYLPRLAIFVLAGTFALKLVLAFTCDTADTGAFNLATRLFVQSQDVYSHPDVHLSPPPLFLHLLAAVRIGANSLQIPFEGAWKLPSILADTAIAIFIYCISLQVYHRSKQQALRLMILYACNPISLFVSGFHGQAESLWILCILVAWYLSHIRQRYLWSAIVAAIAVAIKLPAILLVPGLLLILPTRRLLFPYTATLAIVFVLSLFPEILTSPIALLRQVFLYSSTPDVWGFSLIVRKLFHPEVAIALSPWTTRLLKVVILYFLATAMIRSILKSSKDFFSLSLTILTTFLFFSPGFGSQYLLWLLPFLLLTRHDYIWKYSILTTFAFLNTYGIPLALFIWPVQFLQLNLFYKMNLLYPYDLYLPIWILLGKIVWTDTNLWRRVRVTRP